MKNSVAILFNNYIQLVGYSHGHKLSLRAQLNDFLRRLVSVNLPVAFTWRRFTLMINPIC